jgi:hypothetical protein
MRLILELNNAPVARDDALEILASWRVEHQGYYGQPHGQRRILLGLSWEVCGYSVPVLVPGTTPWHSPIEGHRWLTCGGNDHRIAIQGDTVIVAYAGRRHGMRTEFREFLENYWATTHVGGGLTPRLYQTQEADWMPWETADCRYVGVES